MLDFSISWYEDVLNTFFENMNQSDKEQPVKKSSKLSGSCCWNPEKQLRFLWFFMKLFDLKLFLIELCVTKSVWINLFSLSMVLLLFGYIFSLGQTFSLKVGYLINNAFKNGSLANLVIQVGQSHKRRHLKGGGLVVKGKTF